MTAHKAPINVSNLIHTLRPLRPSRRLLTTSASHHTPEPIPSIPTCPPSACACANMPEGLAIDHDRRLRQTMPPYAQHVVIQTDRDDWGSRIEDEPSEGCGRSNLAKTLKGLVGKGGKFYDPSHSVLITNSFQRRTMKNAENDHVVHIYPQNLSFAKLPDNPKVIENFAWRFLTAERRENFLGSRGTRHIKIHGRMPAERGDAPTARVYWYRHRSPTILICGHMSRDSRCGILGPILKAEFRRQMWMTVKTSRSYPFPLPEFTKEVPLHPLHHTSTSLSSHVGGHAFAGNVIIYFPVDFKLANGGGLSPLAGKAVWYGRVEPRHVDGIVNETMMSGKVIDELLRGINEFPGFTPLERTDRLDIEAGKGDYVVRL